MGGQCLSCDLCGGEFSSKPEWNSHLVASKHQSVSRDKWKNFWSDDFCRETSFIVFSSFVVNEKTGLELVNHLSSRAADYVTQFVWWEERPLMCVVQFESKRKLCEIADRLEHGTDTTVNGSLVQLRKASETLQLEWRAMLPVETPVDEPQPPKLASFEDYSEAEELIHPSSVIPQATTRLQKDWNTVCTCIELTDLECSTVTKIVTGLTQIYRVVRPSCIVALFRNFFLRLQSPTDANNTVLLFPYSPVRDSLQNINTIGRPEEEKILENPDLPKYLPGFKRTTYSPYYFIESTRFQHQSSGFTFNTVSIPLTIAEAHLVRLSLYMAKFDRRLKGVLTLVTYWAKVHNVRIAEDFTLSKYTHDVLPEPFPLQWMVILFLIKEGVLPSVREILERPHDPLMICNKRGPGHDIGFKTDDEFVRLWTRGKSVPAENTDDFILNVVKLTKDFFKFYSEHIKKGCWLLNTRDGELIKREGTRVRKSCLSSKEIEKLTIVEESEKNLVPQVKINYSRISFLHPLVITWRLSFCVDKWTHSTCSKMQEMGAKLEEYLGNRRQSEQTLQSVLAGGLELSEELSVDDQCENNQRLPAAIKTKRHGDGDSVNSKRKRRKC